MDTIKYITYFYFSRNVGLYIGGNVNRKFYGKEIQKRTVSLPKGT